MAANIYSFGMICHAILTRKAPFEASDEQALMQRVVQGTLAYECCQVTYAHELVFLVYL